jgi:hypothetical protein
MADELVDILSILVTVRRFHGMGALDSRSSRFDSYARMQRFVRRSSFVPFRRFLVMCGDTSCNIFFQLFMVLWVHICATLCRSAVRMLFLGLRPVGFFLAFFLLFTLFP